MSGWVGEWVGEWMGGWVSEWVSGWVSEWRFYTVTATETIFTERTFVQLIVIQSSPVVSSYQTRGCPIHIVARASMDLCIYYLWKKSRIRWFTSSGITDTSNIWMSPSVWTKIVVTGSFWSFRQVIDPSIYRCETLLLCVYAHGQVMSSCPYPNSLQQHEINMTAILIYITAMMRSNWRKHQQVTKPHCQKEVTILLIKETK